MRYDFPVLGRKIFVVQFGTVFGFEDEGFGGGGDEGDVAWLRECALLEEEVGKGLEGDEE